jgi:Tol biopolymer transport system component
MGKRVSTGRRFALALLTGAVALTLPLVEGSSVAAFPTPVETVDVSTGGDVGNDAAYHPAISDDGRFVAFRSNASNLVAGDTNGKVDVFVRDRQSGTTERVDVTSAGAQVDPGAGYSFAADNPAISADGAIVAFEGVGAFVPSAPAGTQIYVRNRATGTTELISGARPPGDNNFYPAVSADGRFVAFTSQHVGTQNHMYLYDRQSATTTQVDITTAGVPSAGEVTSCCVIRPAVSADGRYVAFTSTASDLVPGDTNGDWDVFVRDVVGGTTEMVSVDSSGHGVDGRSIGPSISADGRLVAFSSTSISLPPAQLFARSRVFVHDRVTGETTLESVNAAAADGGDDPHLSADGRFLAFRDGNRQIWLRDRPAATSTAMTPTNADWDFLALSGDAARIAYGSGPSNGHIITIPTTVPTVTIATPTNAAQYQPGQAVVASYSCAAQSTATIVSCTGTVPNGAPLDTSTLGPKSFTVTATDDHGGSLTVTRSYSVVDTIAPVVTLTTPSEHAYFAVGQDVQSDYACIEEAGGSGLATCDGSVAAGASIDTSTAGTKTFSVNTTDNAGNSASVDHSYTVVEPISVAASLPSGGGSVTTDSGGSGPSPTVPLQTTVTSANEGDVTLDQGVATDPAPNGFTLLGLQVQIVAPPASADAPLALAFDVDAALLPAGETKDTLSILKDGVFLPDCIGAAVVPDGINACIAGRDEASTGGGDVRITVISTSASRWNVVAHAPVPPALVPGTQSVTEGNTGTRVVQVPVTLSKPSNDTVAVHWATANNTAVAPGDYAPGSGTLTFAPGQTAKSVPVTVKGDTTEEHDEVVLVALSSPTNATLGGYFGVGAATIQDDDHPVVQPGSAAVAEGNSGTRTLSIPVTLSRAPAFTVTVHWATANNTATAPSDYVAASGTLTFNPGQTTRSVPVTVKGDTAQEPDESLLVAFSNATNATIGGYYGLGVGTIQDDDRPPISINDVSITEGNSGTKSLTFRVSLGKAASSSVTVHYATANGTAKTPSDYQARSGTLTIAAGATSANIAVPIVGDTVREPNETFTMVLSSPSANARFVDAQGTGTIVNND